MKFKIIMLVTLTLLSTLTLAKKEEIKVDIHYSNLNKVISNSPPVIEFFSFYCAACYLFADTYQVDKVISESLPHNVKLTKYHVDIMGSLGEELTEAWSIAMVLNLEDEAEKLIFERQKKRTLNSVEDIKSVFQELGISSDYYDYMRKQQDVIDLINKQNKAILEFNVTSTPSIYVLGKYKVNKNSVESKTLEGYPKGLADIISYLLNNKTVKQ